MTPEDHTHRFTGRADVYAAHRPDYPPFVLDVLREDCGLEPAHRMADVGCGTGKLARLFVDNGNYVYGIEPNEEMWTKLHDLLGTSPNFIAVHARAEDTALPPRSVDFVTAGQALHWFDLDAAAAEWRRILRPGGWIVIVYNTRARAGTPFRDDYERFMHAHGIEYATRFDRETDLSRIGRFETRRTPWTQLVDRDAFVGRILSTSYIPRPDDHQRFPPMMDAVAALFDRHAVDGRVPLDYVTEVQYGRFDS